MKSLSFTSIRARISFIRSVSAISAIPSAVLKPPGVISSITPFIRTVQPSFTVAFAAAIIGAFIIFTESPVGALIFLIFLIILQQIDGNLIYPRIMGTRVKLPAIWILAAVTVGGGAAGPIGMLLGVPIASSAYALIKDATENREKKKKD